MRHATRALSLFLCLALLAPLAGCSIFGGGATSTAQPSLVVRTTQYNEIFTSIEKEINDLHDQGYITVAGKQSLAPFVHAGRTALDEMAAGARATPPNINLWQTAFDSFSKAIETMQNATLAAQQKKAADLAAKKAAAGK